MQAITYVLLVEDDQSDAQLVRTWLTQSPGPQQVELVWASSLTEGVQQLATGCFDVVVLDLALGDHSGIHVLKAMLACRPGPPPIVVLSGTASVGVAEACLLGGAAGFLDKSQVVDHPELLLDEILYVTANRPDLAPLTQAQSDPVSGLYVGPRLAVALVAPDASTVPSVCEALQVARLLKRFRHYTSLAGLFGDAASFAPDIALLDIGVPGSRGIDVLQSAVTAFPMVPFVAFSSVDDGRGDEAVAYGAQDFVDKSVLLGGVDDLPRILKRVLLRAVVRAECCRLSTAAAQVDLGLRGLCRRAEQVQHAFATVRSHQR